MLNMLFYPFYLLFMMLCYSSRIASLSEKLISCDQMQRFNFEMTKRAFTLHSRVKKAQNDEFALFDRLWFDFKGQVNVYMLSNQITSIQSGLTSLKQNDVLGFFFLLM